MMRRELIEMHLFDTYAAEKKAHCGDDTSASDRMSVDSYLKRRSDGLDVGTVCERCKALAALVAENLMPDPETDGFQDEAEEYRRLADTLLREIGLGSWPS